MKSSKFLWMITSFMFSTLIFVSCSKDDDKDDDNKQSSSLVGLWKVDNDYDPSTYYEFNKDGSGRKFELSINSDGSLHQSYIQLFNWKDNNKKLSLTRGEWQDFFDYFMSSDKSKMNATDRWGDSYNLLKLNEQDAKKIYNILPVDERLIGFWRLVSTSGGTSTSFVEIDPDGFAQKLSISDAQPQVMTTTYKAFDGTLTFTSFNNLKSSENYDVAEDNSIINFGPLKYVRISEDEYKKQLNAFSLKNTFVGVWVDEKGWAADPTSAMISPKYHKSYLVFYSDGSFITLRLTSSNQSGSDVTKIEKHNGKYKIDRSLFTYSLDNGDRQDATPYRLDNNNRLFCGLPFNIPLLHSDQNWGYGVFTRSNIDEIQKYLDE